jgi:hypothetical protein
VRPHHTSPPKQIQEFADFAAQMVRRFAAGASGCAREGAQQNGHARLRGAPAPAASVMGGGIPGV